MLVPFLVVFLFLLALSGFGVPIPLNTSIRLQDGPSLPEGRVEIEIGDSWRAICDDGWDIRDATVACRQLGYPLGALAAVRGSEYGDGPGQYGLCHLECFGNETSLVECQRPANDKNCLQCVLGEAAGVVCREYQKKCREGMFQCQDDRCLFISYVCDGNNDCDDSSDEDPSLCNATLEIRLVGGRDNSSGRVELKFLGTWGTICDDTFDDLDAQVVCRSLGFRGPASAHSSVFFGPGTGPIWLDGLHCNGSEMSIDECERVEWAHHNCQHWEDVGVTCSHGTDKMIEGNQNYEAISGECGSGGEEIEAEEYDFPLPESTVIELSDFLNASDSQFIRDRIPKVRRKRLVIAKEANSSASFPWIADVRVKVRGSTHHKCGAGIISEFFVVSAAHCLSDFTPSDYVIRVGEFDQNDTDLFQDDFEVHFLIIHEKFNEGVYLNNDIAVVKIKRKAGHGIQFNDFIQPACLPSIATPYLPGILCTIGGWGFTEHGTKSRYLRLAKVPLLSTGQCKYFTEYGVSRIQPGMFCAGDVEGGSDACQADSGGPLIAKINGRSTFLGVISWGFGCGEARKPGIYTSVQFHLKWIISQIRSLDET